MARGWTTTLWHGASDPVDVERARVAVQAARDLAHERGVEELDLDALTPLDRYSRRFDYLGVHLNRVSSQVDPRDTTRGLPEFLLIDANGNLHFFDRSPRQPKP